MLEVLLSDAYRTHVLERRGLPIVSRIMREAFEADDSLRAQASERLSSITEQIARRDYISSVQRDMLRAALAPETP